GGDGGGGAGQGKDDVAGARIDEVNGAVVETEREQLAVGRERERRGGDRIFFRRLLFVLGRRRRLRHVALLLARGHLPQRYLAGKIPPGQQVALRAVPPCADPIRQLLALGGLVR